MQQWRGIVAMIAGIFVGAAGFSAIRTIYYIAQGAQPNIAPQMFIVFSPILAFPITVAAVVLHAIFNKFLTFDRYWKWFLAGISYSSIVLGLISPWLLFIFVILNPVVIKLSQRHSK